MKLVYPVCCGVDVHKSFFIATIITTTSDIQPNYSRKRFLRLTMTSFALPVGLVKTTVTMSVWSLPGSIGFPCLTF